MAISWYDELLGYDWVRYAKVSSKVACVTGVVVGALSIIFFSDWKYSLAALLISAILAIWEFPFIFYCIPHFEEFQSFILEKFYMEREEGKAVLYFFLSILCLSHPSLNVLLGIVLLGSAITQVLAVLNKRADAADGARPISLNDSSALLSSDTQPYTFGASRGSGKSTSSPSTPRQSQPTSSSGLLSGVFGGTKTDTASSAAFGTFDSREMYAEV